MTDPRHNPIRDEIARLYLDANGLAVPWTGHHGRALKRLLDANPSWPVEVWRRCVRHRFATEGINPAEDPIRWIRCLPSYARGPLDRFGRLRRVSTEEAVADYWERRKEMLKGEG